MAGKMRLSHWVLKQTSLVLVVDFPTKADEIHRNPKRIARASLTSLFGLQPTQGLLLSKKGVKQVLGIAYDKPNH